MTLLQTKSKATDKNICPVHEEAIYANRKIS
jgi:hypothetical protein